MSQIDLQMTVLEDIEPPVLPITLHSTPSGDSPVTGKLRAGETVMSKELDDLSGCWVKVEAEGGGGWCHLRDLVPTAAAGLPWMPWAQRQVGVNNKTHKSRIEEYIRSVSSSLAMDKDWCACFMYWCMKQCNKPRVKTTFAKEWKAWPGAALRNGPGRIPEDTKPGDMAIGERLLKGGKLGHIAFIIAWEQDPKDPFKDRLLLLGGNQRMDPRDQDKEGLKSVRYTWYPRENKEPYGKFLYTLYQPTVTNGD
ncbi:SH3 domain-containing C40 family peptidase [Polaromonas sp.]|uniref:SH3 domain-containing C40 family peptidase n=1 Tax=Polaromonas sp. TaxID=1869339 RepID=UPI003751E02F